ncbi:MAG: homocysteine methyltransferase, partial [Spirochaetaceae bacterium]|nr:homocysteine methyltransferase [Spirochaetaceae bacterium]
SSTENAIKKHSEDYSVSQDSLEYAVIRGLKTEAATRTNLLLKTEDPIFIINNRLIPALDIVGKGFEAKRIYLPQLLMSAEATKTAFSVIKEKLIESGNVGESKGKILLATVKGDIHDIGKNIVKVLLENYSFTVIDLGKDVAPEKIVEVAKEQNIIFVGLSALMTTTVPAMEETIKLLRKEKPECKVCVGGAVLTPEYANMIGADFYAKDALETVKYAQKIFC